jgi:hypothetical protein
MIKNTPRPTNVTILAIFVLFITSWNAIRVYSAIVNWQILREFGANPLYILSVGLVWTLTGIWIFKVLWEGQSYAIRTGLVAAGLYFAWYWCDRLFIQPSPAPNTGFSLVFSIVLLGLFCATLLSTKSSTHLYKE